MYVCKLACFDCFRVNSLCTLGVEFSSGQRYEAENQKELAFRMACFMLIDEWMACRIISYLTRLKYAPNKLEYSNREEAT